MKKFLWLGLGISLGLTLILLVILHLRKPRPKKILPSGLGSSQETKPRSLARWFQEKDGVRCQLKLTGGGTMVILAKNGRVRVNGGNLSTPQGLKKANIINDGHWLYLWMAGQKEGIKYPLAAAANQGGKDKNTEILSFSAWQKEWQKYPYVCRREKVADQVFQPPAGVHFLDVHPNQ